MDRTQRIKYIDYAKAITIFFVVMGHAALCPNFAKQWIYSFHMPLFYAFYGMTWSVKKISLSRNIAKKIKRFVIPFVIWAIGYTLVADIIKGTLSVKHIIYDLYGSQMSLKMANSLTSLWFLSCLFVATIAFDVVMTWIESKKNGHIKVFYQGLFLIASFCLGFYLSKIKQIQIGYPWCINVSFMAVFFIQIGYYLKTLFQKVSDGNMPMKVAICLFSFIILTLTYRMNLGFLSINNVDMASSNYGNPLLFLITSLAGIIFVVTFCIIIDSIMDVKCLSFVGMNTMSVMLIHKPIVKGIKLGFETPIFFRFAITIVISIAVVAFSSFCAIILNKYLPFVLGVSSKKKKGMDTQ